MQTELKNIENQLLLIENKINNNEIYQLKKLLKIDEITSFVKYVLKYKNFAFSSLTAVNLILLIIFIAIAFLDGISVATDILKITLLINIISIVVVLLLQFFDVAFSNYLIRNNHLTKSDLEKIDNILSKIDSNPKIPLYIEKLNGFINKKGFLRYKDAVSILSDLLHSKEIDETIKTKQKLEKRKNEILELMKQQEFKTYKFGSK